MVVGMVALSEGPLLEVPLALAVVVLALVVVALALAVVDLFFVNQKVTSKMSALDVNITQKRTSNLINQRITIHENTLRN
jgi:membrane protein implicated in regulation of membrane protease activity